MSASVHQVGDASRTIRPPAARAAATRASARSGGTQTSMWKRCAARGARPCAGTRSTGAPARVDEVLVRAVGASLVPEHGRPERHHVRAGQSVDGHLDGLDLRRVGGQPLLAGQVRDPRRQLDVWMMRTGVADGRGDRLDEPAPAANEPVRKTAAAPPPTTRQSRVGSSAWKARMVRGSVTVTPGATAGVSA